MGASEEQQQAEFQRELRATSDRLVESIARLLELETRKRQLLPGSPAFLELAREVEQLAEHVTAISSLEATLADEVRELPLGRAATTPIDRLAPPEATETLLVRWQVAEKQLRDADPASDGYEALAREARELRGAFRRSRSRG